MRKHPPCPRKLWIVLSTFWTMTSFADQNLKPLLEQINFSGGLISPAQSSWEKCQVFKTEVVIEHHLGTINIPERRQIENGIQLKKLIEKAASEQVVYEDNFMCDGPSTTVVAFLNQKTVNLYSTGGCGSPKETRSGMASYFLMSFLRKFCSKPH